MDLSLITGTLSLLKGAQELGTAAIATRDAQKLTAAVTEINGKLLETQQALFSISTQAFELGQQNQKLHLEKQELQAAAHQRARYTLAEVAPGNFAYRLKSADSLKPGDAEPVHLVCQPCFDQGSKVVLMRTFRSSDTTRNYHAIWLCSACKLALPDFITESSRG
ncbi:hypothetical protein [Xylophilus sp. Leaf220]|uniref:hypothetical protein n=1 Tax=Xylophilus sp. Leaf220 TaxID=1735686 RepID=UPI0006FC695B|nr:hypothetical protein [Xylophilus sp. Leaf220]KQM79835.1 hypothetical protein ASE76_01115 [Xylophilus sp. Leaf220]